MRSNINKVAERGEKLEDIGERAGTVIRKLFHRM